MGRPGSKKTVGESIVAGLKDLLDRMDRGEAIHGTRVERTPDGFTHEPAVIIPGLERSKRPHGIRRKRTKPTEER